MSATFASLKVHNYRLWFGAALVANIGVWMQRIGQDWVVLTVLTDNSGSAMGVVTALQFLPFLLLSPYAGVLADRLPRRKLLMFTQAGMGFLGFVLGALTLSGHLQLWHVYVLAFCLGAVSALDTPVRQTFVGDLVGTELLPNAVGLNSASFNAARMIGPGVSGLLIAWVGPGWVFLLNGVCFAATVVALSAMNVGELRPQIPNPKEPGQLKVALEYIRNRQDIILIMFVVAMVSIFGLNFQIINALMARVEFGMGAGEFGIVGSVMAIGSLGGALLAARRERPRIALVLGAGLGFAIALGAASLMPTYLTYIMATIPMGFASLTMLTAANATIQTTTNPQLRGRVMAFYMMVFQGATPIGAPLIGWIGEHFGPRWAIMIGSIAVAVFCSA
ncbi:MAG: MFS transporter, partial [Promicromonosporaceae bacterium]|nr:MFS transporter [Promicromonosporaceae bacterium]